MADPPGSPGPEVPAQPAPNRRNRPPPVRSPAFDHLALDELRAYRNDLGEEETRVSYWRRVLQARLDTLRGGNVRHARSGRRALEGTVRRGDLHGGRQALLAIVPTAGLPPLPRLEELWRLDVRAAEGADEAATGELLDRLRAAEQQLSAYRRTLHERLDEATAELIARYREQPALAVRALPLTPPTRPRPSS